MLSEILRWIMGEYNRGTHTTITLEVDSRGRLAYLINAAIGAYNRRTDAMLKIAETDPEEVAKLTDRLKRSADALENAAPDKL
jgi:hypothetical protein